jgi:hypothetical protein
VFPSDLTGVNPATLNGVILYYRLMTKWSGLGDSTELSQMGLSQLTPQLLAIFTKLLQRFIAVDKVTIRGDPKLHVHVRHMGQLLIIVLNYLAGSLLSVEEILHVDF